MISSITFHSIPCSEMKSTQSKQFNCCQRLELIVDWLMNFNHGMRVGYSFRYISFINQLNLFIKSFHPHHFRKSMKLTKREGNDWGMNWREQQAFNENQFHTEWAREMGARNEVMKWFETCGSRVAPPSTKNWRMKLFDDG